MMSSTTPTAIPPLTAPAATPAATPAKIRHEWYQTDSHVVVSVFIKKASPAATTVQVQDRSLSVSVPLSGVVPASEYSLELDLAHAVDPSASRHEVLSTKIEISLAKRDRGIKWAALEGSDDIDATVPAPTAVAPVPGAAATSSVTTYPSSSRSGPKNWDAIDKEVATEDAAEKDQGDAALTKLFQQIYKDATPETRRAMIKSYVESNGTALSTNWDEVGKGKVETQPPAGMEAKPFEL
ncbi:SGS domain-containing protein [Blastocladiella britannica]|nr:SGS domain-containing protein [Blastocladiella britannica]